MKKLRAKKMHDDGATVLVVVDELEFHSNQRDLGCHFYVNIKPVAVIIQHAGESYALNMEAQRTSLDKLRQDNPEIDEMFKD